MKKSGHPGSSLDKYSLLYCVLRSNEKGNRKNYLCNGGEDGALRWLVPVKDGAGNQADEGHCHGGGRYSEADVHAGVGLDPNEEG